METVQHWTGRNGNYFINNGIWISERVGCSFAFYFTLQLLISAVFVQSRRLLAMSTAWLYKWPFLSQSTALVQNDVSQNFGMKAAGCENAVILTLSLQTGYQVFWQHQPNGFG